MRYCRRSIKRGMTRFLLGALGLAAVGQVNVSWAQTIPSNLTPGALIQQNTQPWATPQIAPDDKGTPSNLPPSTEPTQTGSPVEQTPQPQAPPVSSQLKVLLK